MSWLRAAMLLSLIVWIGGITFFAFVEAPTLFSVLPTQQLAANVVSPSLSRLHWIGISSALIFLCGSVVYDREKFARFRLLTLSHVFVLLMLALTAFSQFGVNHRMRQLRREMELNSLLQKSTMAERAEFDRLHHWSTRLEGGVLFLGLGVVVLTARRFGN